MQYTPLDLQDSRLTALLSTGWSLNSTSKLERTFTFPDFNAAFGFMSRVALESERRGHHPDWHNVYNRVSIAWWTHDLGGLSEFDLEMAIFCNTLAQ